MLPQSIKFANSIALIMKIWINVVSLGADRQFFFLGSYLKGPPNCKKIVTGSYGAARGHHNKHGRGPMRKIPFFPIILSAPECPPDELYLKIVRTSNNFIPLTNAKRFMLTNAMNSWPLGFSCWLLINSDEQHCCWLIIVNSNFMRNPGN